MTTGLYAGSFDPPHLGHLALIEDAARWCTKLFVVAAGNPAKPDAMFELPERQRLLRAATRHLGNVVALHHAGLVATFAASLDVDVLIRGMGKERAFELEMAVANQAISGIPTVFLAPAMRTGHIASRTVREIYARRGPAAVADMVPPAVAQALHERAGRITGTVGEGR